MPRLTTRDFKRAAPRRSSAGQLAAFAVGVIVGAALASGGFMLRRARAQHAAMPHPSSARSAAPAGARAPAPDADAQADAHRPAGGSTAPAGAATPAHQQYDFYSMLPRFTVSVPQAPAKAARPPAAEPVGAARLASGSAQASYVLQVGSYRRSTEAQAVRARLAREGIDARVERVLAGGGVWYRVRIGPISDPAELERVRNQLRAARMSALEIRIG